MQCFQCLGKKCFKSRILYPVKFSSKCKGKIMTCLNSKYLEGYLCQINYSKLGIKQKDNSFFFVCFQYTAGLDFLLLRQFAT